MKNNNFNQLHMKKTILFLALMMGFLSFGQGTTNGYFNLNKDPQQVVDTTSVKPVFRRISDGRVMQMSWANLIAAVGGGGGGSQDLQSVLDLGSTYSGNSNLLISNNNGTVFSEIQNNPEDGFVSSYSDGVKRGSLSVGFDVNLDSNSTLDNSSLSIRSNELRPLWTRNSVTTPVALLSDIPSAPTANTSSGLTIANPNTSPFFDILQASSTQRGTAFLYNTSGTNTNGGITQGAAKAVDDLKANLAGGNAFSVVQTGLRVPTGATGSNTDAVANEGFVNNAINALNLNITYVKVSTDPVTIPSGTTTETVLFNQALPLGVFVNGEIDIDGRYQTDVTASGAKQYRYYISTVSNNISPANATQIAIRSLTATGTYTSMKRTFHIFNNFLYGYPFTFTAPVDYVNISGSFPATSMALNNTLQYYFIVTSLVTVPVVSTQQKMSIKYFKS